MFCRRCYRNMQNWDITAEEFRIKIMQGAVIIDVRSRQEYREGHLEGAINIPEFEARNRITKEILNKKSMTDHGDIEERMKESEQNYYKTCINIEVHFKERESSLIQEYFPDCQIEKVKDGMCRIFIGVPAKERLWKALLLSFGDHVKVVAPEEYKKELIDIAEKFLSNYDS